MGRENARVEKLDPREVVTSLALTVCSFNLCDKIRSCAMHARITLERGKGKGGLGQA